MAINSQLSTIRSKSKLSEPPEQKQNHGYGEYFDGCQVRGRCGGMGEEVRGLRSTSR